jgi:hypothetical protein
LAQAEADEKRFAAKWDIDPDTLWLAQLASQNPAWPTMAVAE